MPVDDLAHLRELTFEQSLHMGHPAFFAYISGAGTVPGAAAELLAAGLNQCLGGYRLGPGRGRDRAAPDALAGRALRAARGRRRDDHDRRRDGELRRAEVRARPAARHRGPRAGRARPPPVAIYASEEAHVVIRRAADMLGLGADAVRAIAVDGEQRMRVDALDAAIARDVAAGVLPLAVWRRRARRRPARSTRCRSSRRREEHGAWFHVDAAYGGAIVLSDELRRLLAGIERADSIAVDPHKWLYTAQSAGCVLLRDFGHLSRARSTPTPPTSGSTRRSATASTSRCTARSSRAASRRSRSGSRCSRTAARPTARRIAHDVALARYLGELVEEHPDFELMCPPRLSICCFRYRPRGWAGERGGARPPQRAADDRDPSPTAASTAPTR